MSVLDVRRNAHQSQCRSLQPPPFRTMVCGNGSSRRNRNRPAPRQGNSNGCRSSKVCNNRRRSANARFNSSNHNRWNCNARKRHNGNVLIRDSKHSSAHRKRSDYRVLQRSRRNKLIRNVKCSGNSNVMRSTSNAPKGSVPLQPRNHSRLRSHRSLRGGLTRCGSDRRNNAALLRFTEFDAQVL